jgi:hypothetical protein
MPPAPDRRRRNAAALARLRAAVDRLGRLADLPGRRLVLNETAAGLSAFVSADAGAAKLPCRAARRVR